MKNINDFVAGLKDILGARLLSVFAFGAAANSTDKVLVKNVDLCVIVDEWKTDDLSKIHSLVKLWMALNNPCPVFISKNEFYAMSEARAIEYSDMKWNYQIIFGNDFVEPLSINYFDLKLQCDREISNLLLKVRSFYLEHGRSKADILPYSKAVTRTMSVLFRVILRLNNITPSVYKHDVLDQVADILKFDKLFFKKMLDYKEHTYNFSPTEIYDFMDYLIGQLTYILKQLSDEN